ncbi:unnamed protein product [Rhizophagus irregularis]|uniref:Uncharacterized protein n=1 Tax=Rhizophagus irregularis TaxID=588596 RepID=A0A915ZV59_9GLOM|nr:unnamed protein product [Rhizophagus irregularis]CAB5198789.1 unnamed protein product [Rhizophagus irregularis]CAB5388409.1 unnamed protein product [Rhizophagus irregularis]
MHLNKVLRCSIRFAIRINQDLTMLNISRKIITMNCTIATGLDSVIDKMCLANQKIKEFCALFAPPFSTLLLYSLNVAT